MNRPTTRRRTGGFTLIELLVALAIFALVSAMTFSGLNTVLDARARTEQEAARLIELQKTFALLRRDLEAAVDRPIRDQFGDPEPALEAIDQTLVLSRGGRDNPLARHRSALERIGYTLDDEGRLIRTRWPVLDQPIDPQVDELVLIDGVESLTLRFMNSNKEWQEFWPPAGATDPGLPHAVAVELDVEPYGRIERVFLLPF